MPLMNIMLHNIIFLNNNLIHTLLNIGRWLCCNLIFFIINKNKFLNYTEMTS